MAYMENLREKSSNTLKKNTYVTSIMLDRKYFTSTHVVLVLTLIRVELLKELVVHTRRLSMHRFARVVQNNKDTSRTLALNEITPSCYQSTCVVVVVVCDVGDEDDDFSPTYGIFDHVIPSLLYSLCSALSVNSIKIC